MVLGAAGRSVDEVLADLDTFKCRDVRWRDGRAFTLTYFAGDEVAAVQERAYSAYLSENGLNTDAFPSLRTLQSEVVDTVSGWLHGGTEAAGFMTSGGTESILLAVRAARERARAERGITEPEMVLPTSAHAAFEKAAECLSWFCGQTRTRHSSPSARAKAPTSTRWPMNCGSLGGISTAKVLLLRCTAR